METCDESDAENDCSEYGAERASAIMLLFSQRHIIVSTINSRLAQSTV